MPMNHHCRLNKVFSHSSTGEGRLRSAIVLAALRPEAPRNFVFREQWLSLPQLCLGHFRDHERIYSSLNSYPSYSLGVCPRVICLALGSFCPNLLTVAFHLRSHNSLIGLFLSLRYVSPPLVVAHVHIIPFI